MFRVAVALSLVGVVLASLALISCLSVEDKRTIRGMPRFLWVIVILLAPLGGPIAWFLLGRPRPAGGPGASWRAATGFPEPPRPRAPDDDPEFLRSLEEPGLSEQDEKLLREWEENLKRGDDEQHRRDSGTDSGTGT